MKKYEINTKKKENYILFDLFFSRIFFNSMNKNKVVPTL